MSGPSKEQLAAWTADTKRVGFARRNWPVVRRLAGLTVALLLAGLAASLLDYPSVLRLAGWRRPSPAWPCSSGSLIPAASNNGRLARPDRAGASTQQGSIPAGAGAPVLSMTLAERWAVPPRVGARAACLRPSGAVQPDEA